MGTFARPIRPDAKTAALSIVLGAVALCLTARAVAHAPRLPAPSGLALAAGLAVTFFLAERYWVTIEFRRQSHSLTFAGVALMIGVLTLPLPILLAARLIGSVPAFALQKANREKSVYNASAYAFEVCLSSTLAHIRLPTPIPLTAAALGYVLLCVCVVDQLMSLLVLLVIGFHSDGVSRADLLSVLPSACTLAVVTGVFGISATLVMRYGPLGDGLVVVLVGLCALTYRGYAKTTRRHQALELIHEFVTESVGAPSLEALARQSLTAIRELLRAGTVELVLANGSAGTERFCVTELATEIEPTAAPPVDTLRVAALQRQRPALLGARTKDVHERAWLSREKAKDAMIAPMVVADESIGVITVLDRLGESFTFSADDLTLLRTLAGHLAASVRSTRLLERLRYDANHDPLTGLANRARLQSRLSQVGHARPEGVAVMLFDLDKFKEINDVLGHQIGDRLLTEIAGRLQDFFPAPATVARLGGDEFTVLLPNAQGEGSALETAAAACRVLSMPVRLDEALLVPEVSVGVAVGTAAQPDPLRCADTAMYVAKGRGGGVALYQPEMDRGRAERLAMVADLKVALETDPQQFSLRYQPKFDLVDGRIVCVEALVRWNHPTLGQVAPDRFIPLAETSGLIDRLTSHVLSEALHQYQTWTRLGHHLKVAVNLSARNVCDGLLPTRIKTMLQRVGVPAEHLILEITESSIMEDTAAAAPVLTELAALGVELSLDDFGTGYSSLSYLQRLPVKELKIDRSFVLGLSGERASHARALIHSIATLGNALGLRVVAEGIELPEQLAAVRELGCHVGQGYLVSKPLSAAELLDWLDTRATQAA